MDKLEKFLKSKRAFSAFKRNIGSVSYKDYVKGIKKYGLISRAFIWGLSPEGFEYWKQINKEWTK